MAKAWRAVNREKVVAKLRERYRLNPEKYRAYRKRYYESHKKQIIAANGKWTRNRYRMMKHGIPGSHTEEEWQALCKQFDYRCVCCGERRPLTRDHIVPITKPGASDYIYNIQPLCKSCNSQKGNYHTADYRMTPFIRKGQSTLFG